MFQNFRPNDHIGLAADLQCAEKADRGLDLAICMAIDHRKLFGDEEWTWTADGKIRSASGKEMDGSANVPMWTSFSDHAFVLAKLCFDTRAIEFEVGERYANGKPFSRARIIGPNVDIATHGQTRALALCTAIFSAANSERKLAVRSDACAS